MKLTEAEMRMVFQIESTNQNAALNEIYMTWRYAPNPATKETAESLLDKLRPLSDQECMDLIRKVQAEYLQSAFDVFLPRCPQCGLTMIPRTLAEGKMLEVERLLEDK